jgi:Tfp pilus assembly protein PilP
MEFMSFFRRLTRKQVLLAILVFSAVLAITIYYDDKPETASAPAVQPDDAAVKSAPPQAIVPKGFQAGNANALRDPFAVPKQFEPVKPPGGGPLASPAGVPAGKTIVDTPLLSGVVGGDGKWVAIIQLGDQSRSYQLQDYVGNYQVVAIAGDSATLAGPGGPIMLSVGKVKNE